MTVARTNANETDQFLMPEHETFVDLGPMLNLAHYKVLSDVVQTTNQRIDRAAENHDDAAIKHYHDPAYIATQVQAQFGPGFLEMIAIEDAVRSHPLQTMAVKGKLTAYRNPQWIYFMGHLPVDPRNMVLLFQSSTIRAFGVHFGVDKWGHFHDLGNFYFQDYRHLIEQGDSPEQAQKSVVWQYSRGLLSESAMIGSWATGVQSNADLAANFAGFKFYCNLTQAIRFNGERLEPMLVRRGRYWALNLHVRPESNFMAPFITDHWNEALNPGRVEIGLRVAVQRRVHENAKAILDFYQTHEDRPPIASHYVQVAQELETFTGEDYGHLPLSKDDVTIANTCFPQPTP